MDVSSILAVLRRRIRASARSLAGSSDLAILASLIAGLGSTATIELDVVMGYETSIVQEAQICGGILQHVRAHYDPKTGDPYSCLQSMAERIRSCGMGLLYGMEQARQRLWPDAVVHRLAGNEVSFDFHSVGRAPVDSLMQLLRRIVSIRGASQLKVAEIGVRECFTSVALLQAFPTLNMVLVDPYNVYDDEASSNTSLWFGRDMLQRALARLRPYMNRATVVLQRSFEAASWMKDNSFDLVFIDGDHEFDYVQQDIEVWWPLVRECGILSGHDYTIPFQGVVAAVNAFAARNNLKVNLASEMWWIEKPSSSPAHSCGF